MKGLIVFACLLVAIYAEIPPEVVQEFKDKIHKIGEECKGEIGASDVDISPLLHHEPPTTDKGKCFAACMNKKIGFQDASGKIDKDGTFEVIETIKSVDEEMYGKMKKVAETCLAEVHDADNECETAADMFVCVKREKAAAGLPSIDLQP